MTRFDRTVMILDQAVGGPRAPIGVHGAFWRGITRDQFIAVKVFGRDLISLGRGAQSNLIKALRGEAPFGADLPTSPPTALFRRMPAGRPAVSEADIAFIQQWIDDGCPEDEMAPGIAGLAAIGLAEQPPRPLWHRTNAPLASIRTDDIWFLDERMGWAVNSNGHVLKTSDGGESWERKFAAAAYLRCVAFSDPMHGWVGTLTANRVLFRTVDGGDTWTQVRDLPPGAPVKVCGMTAVSRDVVIVAGSNDPVDPPRMMKTVDGGRTWMAWDMRAHASMLIDVHFLDENRGWVVGGKADVPNPTDRSEIKPVVLFTEDGGKTWINRLAGQEAEFPFGEWGWKIHFVNERLGFVSLENFFDAAVLKTTDGGQTFTRMAVNDPQGNANIEGVGFIDEQTGWVGGWGDADFQSGLSSASDDGGRTWRSANDIGKFLNRFRFLGKPTRVGYASGDTVYKYSTEVVRFAATARAAAPGAARQLLPVDQIRPERLPVTMEVKVPAETRRLAVDIWTRFGTHIGTIVDEAQPAPGPRLVAWDGKDDRGRDVPDGEFIVRVTADDGAESGVIVLRQRRRQHNSRRIRWVSHTVSRSNPARALAMVTALPADTVVIDLPDLSAFPTALEKVAFLLHTAAEIEHALLVQYLYAAYSLKKPGALSDPAQASAVRRWTEVLIGIAREEMGHLLTVQNLLLLLNQPLNFEREDFPQLPHLYPFKLELEPLTRKALAKYVVAESPVDAEDVAEIVAEATAGAGGMPNRVGIIYALLGVVFSETLATPPSGDPWEAMVRAVAALAFEQDADPAHWHVPNDAFTGALTARQATAEEWSPSGPVRVWSPDSRAVALAALKDVAVQGEGPTHRENAVEPSHFDRFLAMYRGADGILPFPTGEWIPALEVPTNPRTTGDPTDPAVIHAAKARDLARLADLRYGLLLGWLEQCLTLGPDQRAPLVGWCFAEMAALEQLSDRLTQLPRAGAPQSVAALPFSLPDELHLPAEPPEQWALHVRRLNRATALIDDIVSTHGGTDTPLKNQLTRMKGQDQQRLQFAIAAGQGTIPSVPLGRYARVQRILDSAAGFGMPVHGGLQRFWRQPLSQFLATSVLGHDLIAPPGPDRGKNSNLVKVLRGEAPFESMRMPRNRPPIEAQHIAFIERWIDDGCPES